MHMADALVSPAVAVTMYAASAAAAGVSLVQLHKEEAAAPELAKKKLPTMAVMSALVFAGQMINYTIPGTGSSGHLCGGMLLSAILGPWAGFLSMIVILAIQALFFADGGLLALGANVWNMAFYGCFVGYFLIYRPLMQGKLLSGKGRTRLALASGPWLRRDAAARRVLRRGGDVALRHHGSAVRRVRGADAADPSGHRPGRGRHHGGSPAVRLPDAAGAAAVRVRWREKPLLAQSRAGDPGCRGAGHRRRPVAAGKLQPRRAGMVAVRQ